MTVSRLTTVDNPYDPFDQYDEWEAFDRLMGYNTPQYLARIVPMSDELSYRDNNLLNEAAIDEIVELNILGIYKKVSRVFEDENENE